VPTRFVRRTPGRVAWRVVVPQLLRVSLGLAGGAAAVGAGVWALDRASVRAERRVWGADLSVWAGRLEAPNAPLRDSAIVAVSELASRRWSEIGGAAARRPASEASSVIDTVLAAVRALTRRLGDPDSVIREHAVSAVLDVTERRLDDERHAIVRADTLHLWPLRETVRRAAGEVLRAAVRPRRPGAELATLEVLATVGAPANIASILAGIAVRDRSPAVRALAATVALHSAASGSDAGERAGGRAGGRAGERAMLLRAVLDDTSGDVRLAAVEALLHDPTLLCRDDALQRRIDAHRRDGDAAVRSAIAALPESTVMGRACRSAGS
jgi:hypothetical protein